MNLHAEDLSAEVIESYTGFDEAVRFSEIESNPATMKEYMERTDQLTAEFGEGNVLGSFHFYENKLIYSIFVKNLFDRTQEN